MALNDDILGGGQVSGIMESIQQISKAWNDAITTNYKSYETLSKIYLNKELEGHRKSLEQQLRNTELSAAAKKKALDDYMAAEKEQREKLANLQKKIDEELYNKASFYDKKRITERRLENAREAQRELDEQIAMQKAIADETGVQSEMLDKLVKQREALVNVEKKELEQQKKLEQVEYKRLSFADKTAKKKDEAQKAEKKYKELLMQKDLGDESITNADIKQAKKEALSAGWAASLQESIQKLGQNLGKAISDGLNKIDSTMDTLFKNQGRLNARLMGSGQNYQDMLKDVSAIINLSPYVSQKAMVENIAKLIDSGVSYNVEQRAFLATIAEDIASTFDVFDSNLMRLIRLQQADTTAARLGMEAMLTEFLNKSYNDTSYMQSTYDAVSQAILDASSQLTHQDSTRFSYITQAWLSSLGSLGLSESAATSIATGLNLLGTGNVSALSSNSQLQTLMALSASRAGLDYAKILTGGLTPETTNELLMSMVEYLREIAKSNNLVVKSQYGQMFGLSMSDLRALQNLTDLDVQNIYQQGQSFQYKTAKTYLNAQIGTLGKRMSIAEMIENVFDNAITGVASAIGGNVGSYATWKVTDLIEKATGGINIPTVGALGNFLDMNATVTQLMKLGIAGGSVLGLIGPIVNAFARGGGKLSLLDSWANTYAFNHIGSGLTGITNQGVTIGTSSVGYVGSASTEDIYADTLYEQKERAEKTQEILGSEDSTTKDIYALIESIIEKSGDQSYIRVWVVNDSPISVAFQDDGSPNRRDRDFN